MSDRLKEIDTTNISNSYQEGSAKKLLFLMKS